MPSRRHILCSTNCISLRPQESIPRSLSYRFPATRLSLRHHEKVLLSFIGLTCYLIKSTLLYPRIHCQQFYCSLTTIRSQHPAHPEIYRSFKKVFSPLKSGISGPFISATRILRFKTRTHEALSMQQVSHASLRWQMRFSNVSMAFFHDACEALFEAGREL